MSEYPAMPLFCEPLLADTDHLTDAEMGIYIRLLARLWLAPRHRFPDDDAWLARRFRRTAEQVQADIRPLLLEFFRSDGGGLFHKRIDKEFAHVKRTTDARRGAAKSRWNKEKDACKPHAPTPTLTPTKNQEPQTPETPAPNAVEPELPLAPSAPAHVGSKSSAAEPDGFAAFYAAYPKKVDRPKALSAYRTARKFASVEVIAAGLQRWVAGWASEQTDRKYIPAPAVWLHGHRWADDAPGQARSSPQARASPPIDPRLAARLAEAKARNAARASAEAAGLKESDEEYDRHVSALMMEWYNNEQRRSA